MSIFLIINFQYQGEIENFKGACKGKMDWINNRLYNMAFFEGWGLYAESPLVAKDTDVYDNQPMQKYGMLKWQVNNGSLHGFPVSRLRSSLYTLF